MVPPTESDTGVAALTAEQQAFWDANGYLVLKGFFTDQRIAKLRRDIGQRWNDRSQDNRLVVDILQGELAGQRMLMRDAPPKIKRFRHKLNDLYLESEVCRSLCLDPLLEAIVRQLIGDTPVVINSLNFQKGSQQNFHFDTYFMPPPVEGAMAVSSICLEDHGADAGPLMYYPGSHKIPQYVFPDGTLAVGQYDLTPATEHVEAEVAARGLTSETFCGMRGDVFIWHAHLYHGGSEINDRSLTRKSLVTHYWGETGMDHGPIATTDAGGHYLDRAHPPLVLPF